MNRVVDLTLRLIDGAATDAELRELERLTESDRGARALHLELLEIEAALRAGALEDEADRSLTEERTVQAVMRGLRRAPVPRPPRRRFAARPIWAALALAGLAASLAVVAWPRGGGKRRAASAPFAFGRSRAPREAVEVSHAGWTAAPMRVRATGVDGVSRIDVDDLALESRGAVVRAVERDGSGTRRVIVDEGNLVVEATSDDAATAVVLVTPHAQVTARLRRAVVSVSAELTRFDLHDGTATVRRPHDGRTVDLVAHQGVDVGDEAALSPRALPTALFVGGHLWPRHPTDLLDDAIIGRLETLGYVVDPVDELELKAAHLADKALIFISPSVSQAMLPKIEDLSMDTVAVPLICSRPSLFPALAMAAEDQGFASNATRLVVLEPGHPLAAGMSGPQQVTRGPGPLGWGQPGPEALRIASFPDARKSDRAVIFAYERGVAMTGGARAPARRVGFFLHPDIAPYVTEAGWSLLTAAVRWATSADRP